MGGCHDHDGWECTGHRFDHVKEKFKNERIAQEIKKLLRAHPDGLKSEQIARKVLGLKFAPPEASKKLVGGLIGNKDFCEFRDERWHLLDSEFTSLDIVPFAVVDVETTGGHAPTNRIIEMGAFKVSGGVITASFMTLINPGRKIPLQISHLTGIYDEHVKHSPKAADILPRYLDFVEDCVFVGHNARFDYAFMNSELKRAGLPEMKNEVLCTLKLARRAFPGEDSYGLDNMIRKFNLEIDPLERHRGHGDAWATAELLNRCIDIFRNAGVDSLEELLKINEIPPAKVKKMYGTG